MTPSTVKRLFVAVSCVAVITSAALLTPLMASASSTSPHVAAHIVGVWADNSDLNESGGWVLLNNGNVMAKNGAPYYGGGAYTKYTNFIGMVPDYESAGYWLITSSGKVISDGTTCQFGKLVPPKGAPTSGVVGAIDLTGNPSETEGFTMVTSAQKLYNFTCVITDTIRHTRSG